MWILLLYMSVHERFLSNKRRSIHWNQLSPFEELHLSRREGYRAWSHDIEERTCIVNDPRPTSRLDRSYFCPYFQLPTTISTSWLWWSVILESVSVGQYAITRISDNSSFEERTTWERIWQLTSFQTLRASVRISWWWILRRTIVSVMNNDLRDTLCQFKLLRHRGIHCSWFVLCIWSDSSLWSK